MVGLTLHLIYNAWKTRMMSKSIGNHISMSGFMGSFRLNDRQSAVLPFLCDPLWRLAVSHYSKKGKNKIRRTFYYCLYENKANLIKLWRRTISDSLPCWPRTPPTDDIINKPKLSSCLVEATVLRCSSSDLLTLDVSQRDAQNTL